MGFPQISPKIHRTQDSSELFDGTLRVAFALHRSKAASDAVTLRARNNVMGLGWKKR